MKLSDLGEFGLIRSIQKASRRRRSPALIGIGDDAAALQFPASRAVLVTTDLLLEHIHFDLSYTDYYSLGWKAAAVNLSDIAAMGGTPRYCLTAIGLPAGTVPAHVRDFYRGFNALLARHKAFLVGGDTCASPGGLFVSVTAVGEVERGRVITRAGARPGDRVFVTGTLGDAAAGLELLKTGARSRGTGARSLIQKHLRPEPRIREARVLALSGCASAMIDVSDGLSSDLGHLCEQSGVGAEILAGAVPLSAPLKQAAPLLSKPALRYALAGGEDYELLFTVPRERVRRLLSLKLRAREIGTITAGKRMFLVDRDGTKQAFLPQGYDHFPPQREETGGGPNRGGNAV